MTNLEAAISNTTQFKNYSEIDPVNYRPLQGDYSTSEYTQNEIKLIVFRLKEWRKDNIEYFTGGELCGIDHVINMLVAGKV